MKTMLRPLAQAAEHRKQALHLGRRQGRGRLVENDDARAGKQHAGELDQLLQADRQSADASPRIDIDAEAGEMAARLLRHAPPVDESGPVHRLRAEEDVLGDRQIRRDAQLLMHHADARGERIAGGAEVRSRPSRRNSPI